MSGKKYPYTGEEIQAGVSIPGVYEVSGEYVATNVRETAYHYTATLAPDLKWSDNTKDPVDVDWWIVPGTNSIPTPLFERVTYDGENHQAVGSLPAKTSFADGSVSCATNVGEYAYTVQLDDPVNYRWSDGSVTNQTFKWSITPRQITPQPLPTGVVYAGTNVVAATNNPNYAFAEGSVTSATNAGNYKVVFELADPANNRWPDGSVTNLTYWWSIARMPVDYPPVRGTPGKEPWNFVYDGTMQVAVTNSAYYSLDGTKSAVNVGDYFFTATLNDNWCWKDEEAPLAPYPIVWHIVQAPNEITSLTLSDWKLGETPKTPSITAKFGANTVRYSYGASASGSEWSPEPPDTNGVFYVKAYIPEEAEFGNWSSAERTKRFLVYKSFEELFTDYVDIDFSGVEDTSIEDFRVLVKISPAIYPGFTYERCPTGEDLAFMNMTGGQDQSPLSFDVDTWNTAGDSYVWVKLPKLETRAGYAETRIRMYWHLRDGMVGPGSDATEVWRDYAGVWHFSETITAMAAATAPSHDATGNGYDALPRKATGGNLTQMVSTPGQIGAARVNASQSFDNGGNNLVVSNFTGCALGANFVFEGWVKFDNYNSSKSPWIFARKRSGFEGGFALALDATDRKKLDLYGSGTASVAAGPVASQELKNGWVYVCWAVSGDRYWLNTRSPNLGSSSFEGTLASPVGEDLAPLVFGCDLDVRAPSVYGKFDEFRLRPWDGQASSLKTITNALNATYANTQNPTEFVKHGWVVVDGVKQNYWKTPPSLSKDSWEETDPPAVVNPGEPAIGSVTYVCERQFAGDAPITNALPTAAGRYIITFTVEEEGFNTLVEKKNFSILGHADYPSVGTTEEGRILLANDDSMGDWGETSVTNQAYWQTRYVDELISYFTVTTNINPRTGKILYTTNWFTRIVTTTNSTYWTHSGESTHHATVRPYLLTNSIHTLETTNVAASLCGGTRLWHLNQVRIGNLYMADQEDIRWYNYLPWSETSCAISTNGAVFSRKEIGNMMLRNTTEACIYSPCYTNGIGTIYFDAVNFQADGKPVDQRLVVEVATSVTNETGEVILDERGQKLLPTDLNVQDFGVRTNEVWSEDGESCVTNLVPYTNDYFYARAKWEPVKATMVKIIGNTSITPQTPSETIELGITEGGSHENFYRIYVPLTIREPARFRIRRTSADPRYTAPPDRDNGGQILIDNIIASKPTMRADMESLGRLDLAKAGPSVLGMEGATSVPYPAITDTDIRGRARAIYQTCGETDVDTNAFVTGVSFHYRWRYLNQNPGGASAWREPIEMQRRDGVIETVSALQHPGAEGDIEYWYETFLQAPFYSYTDYSGTGHGLNGLDGRPYYTEELAVVTNHFSTSPSFAALGGAPQPSLGDDWFFRLRNGRDDAGSATLVITEGALAGEYPMHLAEDNTWRCLLALPRDTEGVCRFYFRVNDRQEPGTTEFVRNETFLSPDADVAAFPVKGKLVDGAAPRSFTIDHASTHLEWRFNDRYATYAVTRSSYMDFNSWSDTHSRKADPVFYASYTDTNGVNVTDMKNFSAPMGDWVEYSSTNASWNETFYLGNYNDPAYPKDVIYPSHATPNAWGGDYIAFVSELLGGALTKVGSEYLPYPVASGMAGKLIGQGKGRLNFTLADRPDGLENVTFKARIGQSLEFGNFAYSMPATAGRMRNYMFTSLASMSHLVTDNNKECDMAAGGALSLIAYYQPYAGCYEFRVERIETGTRLMVSIWKWHLVNGALEATCLVKRRMDSRQLWTNNSGEPPTDLNVNTANKRNPQYRLMFISVSEAADGTGTEVYGGLSYDAQLPFKTDGEASYNKMANGYHGIYYKDTAGDRFKYGSYGLGAKDCPAEFLLPRRADAPVKNISLYQKNNNDYEFLKGRTDANARWFRTDENKAKDIGAAPEDLDWGDVEDIAGDEYGSLWALPPNRIEYFVNTWITSGDFGKYHQGLRIPTDLRQDVIVQLAPSARPNNWETIGTNTVSGYGFTPYTLPLYRKGTYNLRLTTGEMAVDVVVDDVKQLKWMGEDSSGIQSATRSFIFTQGHVVTNAAAQRKEIELVPARAHASRAQSVRSPMLDGLGRVTFEYAAADPHAEVWVQMATNHVDGNLPGSYNDSVRSVDYGRQQEIGEWITLAKYTYANADPELALGASGKKTVYVGLHNQKDRPIQGVFRLFIPTNVVAATDAMTSRQLDEGGKDYGRITITGMSVSDEPGLDERSWRSWNMRTVGDEKDLEKRMYLADMSIAGGGYGLVCALNNSINDTVDRTTGEPAPEKARTGQPAIWSPTFGAFTNALGSAEQAMVGEVTFKARVYGERVEKAPAKVTLYGSSNSVIGRWEKVAEFTVDTPYFLNYSWKAGAESYAALRFEVSDPTARTTQPRQDRVILDEITICERVQPTLSFVYAWPFRNGLNGDAPVEDVGTPAQQPLAGENWGVQTRLALQQLGDEVDVDRGLEIYLSYFNTPLDSGGKPLRADWGYSNWKSRASGEVRLEPVGDPSNLVFRSVASVPASVMPPSPDAGTVVQFMLRVKYYDRGGYPYESQMQTWTPPPWYHPVDYNATLGGPGLFSAYTILDSISPGRAWINEVNWNNGSKSVTHTSSKVVNNQFLELCVPSGADLSGWKVRVTNLSGAQWTMATLGSTKVRASKTTGRAVNGYEFFLIESPETQLNGDIKDPDGDIDGVWNDDGISTVTGGTLSYANPFAFELIRPSGVIEHAFTIDGTNEWGTAQYDATNLLVKLNAADSSPRRFYAGRELEKNENGGDPSTRGTTFGSSGVTGTGSETGDLRAYGPGSEGTWTHGLDFTPGGLNGGQVIPEGWFLAPNGTNTWVYFTVRGDHLHQMIGGETGRSVLVILPQGQSTNVVYAADPWYETATIVVDGVTNAVHRPGTWPYSFSVPEGSSTMVHVTATDGVDARLDDDKFGLKGQRYRDAVVKWLQDKWPDRDPDDIRFARYGHLKTFPATRLMTLIEMYWLDIPPFNSEGSTFAPTGEMDPLSSEWVFRGAFTDYAPNSVIREKSWGKVTNSVFKVKLMITNEFDSTVYAPKTLQGLNYESSAAGNYTGGWTSVSFKIYGFLDVNRDGGFNKGFKPFREFVFNPYSFGAPDAGEGTKTADGHPGTPGAFETVIELLDPFSKGSIGYEYGWWRHANDTPAFFKWQIDSADNTPVTVETLKSSDTYGD